MCSVGTDRVYLGAPLVTELDRGHPSAFTHDCAEAAAIVEQQLVEIGAPDVITVTDAQIGIAGKAECRRLRVTIRNNFRTGLIDPDTPDLVGNAEPFEQWQIERQQRFSDVKAGKSVLFQYNDMSALLREQRGDGRSGRTAADNQDIAFSAILHL